MVSDKLGARSRSRIHQGIPLDPRIAPRHVFPSLQPRPRDFGISLPQRLILSSSLRQVWTGAGRHDRIGWTQLRNFLRERKPGKELRAPSTNRRKPNQGRLRWKTGHAVVGVATLLLQFGDGLVEALQCDWAREELPNAQEQAAALRKRNAQLEEQVRQVQSHGIVFWL